MRASKRRGRGGSNNFRQHKGLVGAYCTHGARSRRFWGWRGKRLLVGSEYGLEDHIIDEFGVAAGITRKVER